MYWMFHTWYEGLCSVEDYDVVIKNIDNGLVYQCFKQSKTQVDLKYVNTTNMLE
jgi:hypothetical protein